MRSLACLIAAVVVIVPAAASAAVIYEGELSYKCDDFHFSCNPGAIQNPAIRNDVIRVGLEVEVEPGTTGTINLEGFGSENVVGARFTYYTSGFFGDFAPRGGTPPAMIRFNGQIDAGGTQLILNEFQSGGAPFVVGPGTPLLTAGNVLNLSNGFTDFVAGTTGNTCSGFVTTCQLQYRPLAPPAVLTRRPPGASPGDPALPGPGPAGCTAPCFEIPVTVDPDGPGGADFFYIDPDVAVGYDYAIAGASGLFFDSVLVPEQGGLATGDPLDLLLGSDRYTLLVGSAFDFFDDGGVTDVATFSIRGIDAALGLDPADPRAFVTGLRFEGAGGSALTTTVSADVIMSPITVSTDPPVAGLPAPATWSLLALGLLGAAHGRGRAVRRTGAARVAA